MKRLTAEVQEKIVSAVAGGSYRGTAAAGGVDRETFQRWMERGERAKSGKQRAFYKAVLQAEAEMEERVLSWKVGSKGGFEGDRGSEALGDRARGEGRSMAELVNEAIRTYLRGDSVGGTR